MSLKNENKLNNTNNNKQMASPNYLESIGCMDNLPLNW